MVIIFLVFLFFYMENNFLVTDRLSFSAQGRVEEPIKILHLSDMHTKKIENIFTKLSSNIAKNDPDLILITGDIVSSDREDSLAYIDYLKKIFGARPVYYVTGNHEAANYEYLNEFNAHMKAAGFKLIDGKAVTLRIKKTDIYIAGLLDPNYYGVSTADEVEKRVSYLQTDRRDVFRILLAHRSEFTPVYNSSNFDLILTGHAHGGIVGIPFSKGNLYSTAEGFFPKYTKGLHQKTYISRGLGSSRFFTRLFNHPQVSYITVKN